MKTISITSESDADFADVLRAVTLRVQCGVTDGVLRDEMGNRSIAFVCREYEPDEHGSMVGAAVQSAIREGR